MFCARRRFMDPFLASAKGKIPRVSPQWLAGLLGTLLSYSTAVSAQFNPASKPSTSKNTVCPLSDSQSQKSIEAFAKMVPTLTQEPRCVNCHGGLDPFADPTSHAGGTMDAKSDCGDCHSELPARRDGSPSKWRLANPEHFFLGKDAKTLCRQMRDVFAESADFIGHLIDDNGNSKFTEVAFEGTRGLNDAGRALVDRYLPEPPKRITQGGLINQAMDWINAMGGEFKGDVDCGCEPHHYAVRVFSSTNVNLGIVHAKSAMPAPMEIPITFHDDGSFNGEAVLYFNGTEMVSYCSGQTTSVISVKVSGRATEQFQNNHMVLRMENTNPMAGVTYVQCPQKSVTTPLRGGAQRSIDFHLIGKVGEAVMFSPLAGIPGVDSAVRAEIIKVGP